MLVVDGVKLVFGHQPQEMGKFQGYHTLGFKQDFQAPHKVIQSRYVRQNIVAYYQVGEFALPCQFLGQVPAKKSLRVVIPFAQATLATLMAGSMPRAGMPYAENIAASNHHYWLSR